MPSQTLTLTLPLSIPPFARTVLYAISSIAKGSSEALANTSSIAKAIGVELTNALRHRIRETIALLKKEGFLDVTPDVRGRLRQRVFTLLASPSSPKARRPTPPPPSPSLPLSLSPPSSLPLPLPSDTQDDLSSPPPTPPPASEEKKKLDLAEIPVSALDPTSLPPVFSPHFTPERRRIEWDRFWASLGEVPGAIDPKKQAWLEILESRLLPEHLASLKAKRKTHKRLILYALSCLFGGTEDRVVFQADSFLLAALDRGSPSPSPSPFAPNPPPSASPSPSASSSPSSLRAWERPQSPASARERISWAAEELLEDSAEGRLKWKSREREWNTLCLGLEIETKDLIAHLHSSGGGGIRWLCQLDPAEISRTHLASVRLLPPPQRIPGLLLPFTTDGDEQAGMADESEWGLPYLPPRGET